MEVNKLKNYQDLDTLVLDLLNSIDLGINVKDKAFQFAYSTAKDLCENDDQRERLDSLIKSKFDEA